MKPTTIYQTIRDSQNPREIETIGPFLCNREDAWLGEGFYFWEEYIENAKFWGKVGYNNDYMITRAVGYFNSSNCFDLTTSEHRAEMRKLKDLFLKHGLSSDEEELRKKCFKEIIDYLRLEIKIFQYSALKIDGAGSKSYLRENDNQIIFSKRDKKRSFIDLEPPIQICIYDLRKVGFSNYKVIYPVEYDNDYVA